LNEQQYIMQNKNELVKLLEKYPNKPWYWTAISENPNITVFPNFRILSGVCPTDRFAEENRSPASPQIAVLFW